MNDGLARGAKCVQVFLNAADEQQNPTYISQAFSMDH
jgi:hypothetical protein